jgi:hypothetical protein
MTPNSALVPMLALRAPSSRLLRCGTTRTLGRKAEIAISRGATMIRVSVFYEKEVGKRFDLDYYLTQHIPLGAQRGR